MATRQEFVAAMGTLYAAGLIERQNRLPAESTAREDLYWTLLQDVPGDLLLAAVMEWPKRSKWFPTVAEIRETAREIMSGAGLRSGPMSPEEAYECVARYIANRGDTDEPPRAAMRALWAVGGTYEWRHSERPGLLRKDFIEAYKAFSQSEPDPTAFLPSTRELQRRLSIRRAQEEAERLLLGEGDDDAS